MTAKTVMTANSSEAMIWSLQSWSGLGGIFAQKATIVRKPCIREWHVLSVPHQSSNTSLNRLTEVLLK